MIARSGAVLRAVAQDERSQARNRELAVERLVARLAEALRVERRRVPTKPTRAARERRLEDEEAPVEREAWARNAPGRLTTLVLLEHKVLTADRVEPLLRGRFGRPYLWREECASTQDALRDP